MKMTKEHFDHIQHQINEYIKYRDTTLVVIREQYQEAGLSDNRMGWDLLRYAGLTSFVCNTLYSYLNASHIDTALRTITKGA